MATATEYLGLTKPSEEEYVSVDVINENMEKIDEEAREARPVKKGGTGKTSWAANRIIYASAAEVLAQMAFPTTAGSFLRQDKSGAPYWSTPAQVLAAIGAAAANHTHIASDVGALPLNDVGGVHNLKTYTSLAQIEMTATSSIEEIVQAMPDMSELYADVYEPNSATFPLTAGSFHCTKLSNYRVQMRFYHYNKPISWFGVYENGVFSGWVEDSPLTQKGSGYDIDTIGTYIKTETSNDSSDSLVTASGKHLYTLYSYSGSSNTCTQYAFTHETTGTKMWRRTYIWWTKTWSPWVGDVNSLYALPLASDIVGSTGFYCHYTKNIDGFVHLAFRVMKSDSSAISSGTVLGTLPVGYRPIHALSVNALIIRTGAVVANAIVEVRTNGEIYLSNSNLTDMKYVALECSFYVG